MNCQTCKELLVSYMEQLLDESQAHEVAEHVKNCPSCQAELKGLQTLQGRLVQNGQAAAQRDLEEPVMNRIIREQKVRLKAATEATAGLRLRRSIMKSPMTKVAVAAVVVLGCLLALPLWTGTQSIALADVLAKVQEMQAYFYRETASTTDKTRGDSTGQSTVLISEAFGMKTDVTTVNVADATETRIQMHFLPAEKSIIVIDRSEKRYTRMKLDDESLENAMLENHDPRKMIERLLACEHEELGEAVVDGVTVVGFETTDPTYLGGMQEYLQARLWVDTETWLPVRYELEMEIVQGVTIKTVQHDYQWGIPVDADDFEPDIPADFTAHELNETQMPSYSETGVIEALKLAADLTGRYPEALSIEALQQTMKDIATSETPAAQQLRQKFRDAGSPEAAAMASQEHLMKMMVITMFPRMLATQQAEPIYHGDKVTPQDTDLPLMRWKTENNEYRVILGDLSVETVTAETLAELEAALPK